MTAARDELAELIRARCWPQWRYPETPESIADAILAAGWRPPKPDELSDAARDNLEHWSRDRLDG